MTLSQQALGAVAVFDPPNPRPVPGENQDVDVSFVKMASVSAETGTITVHETRRLQEVLTGFTYFQDSDILVAKITPCFENGKIAQARIPHAHGFGSTEFHVIRADRTQLDARYLLHFLRLPHVRLAGERRMTGSAGQRRVPRNFLETLRIPIPSLGEQRRIAAILDQAEALRTKRRQALAKLDTLTQSLFLESFHKATTFRPLASLADVVSGVTKSNVQRASNPLEVPYIRVANVQAGFLDLSQMSLIKASEQEVAALQLKDGDVLMTEGGDHDKLGRGALWRSEVNLCIHQNHIFRVRVDKDQLLPEVFHYFLQTDAAKRYFLRCAKKTSNLASINMTQLKALPTMVPTMCNQQKFVERLAMLSSVVKRSNASRKMFDNLFASLQHRAFHGEL